VVEVVKRLESPNRTASSLFDPGAVNQLRKKLRKKCRIGSVVFVEVVKPPTRGGTNNGAPPK
jgi:hypothetical protein